LNKHFEYNSTKICIRTGGIYILHHLGFRVRIVLDRGAVDPLPMLNIPGVEGLKVGAAVIPKLRVGAAGGAVKLNPVVAGLEDTDPNWNGTGVAAVELLLPALKLDPKGNVVFCCPSF